VPNPDHHGSTGFSPGIYELHRDCSTTASASGHDPDDCSDHQLDHLHDAAHRDVHDATLRHVHDHLQRPDPRDFQLGRDADPRSRWS
jgi:hypothetical protein